MNAQAADPSDASDAGAGVVVRRMTRDDLAAVLPYEKEMFGSEAWSRATYLDELADTELRDYVVATAADGTILGDGGVMTIGATAQVMTVAVLPPARRRGVGRTLVQALVTIARRRQAEELLLEVRVDNAAAIGLYVGLGFVAIGRRRGYYDHGRVDASVMRLDLAESDPAASLTASVATTMWEVRVADGRLAALQDWVNRHAPAGAQIYRSGAPDVRLVVIDPTGTAADTLREVPPGLVARPPHAWDFEPVQRGEHPGASS